MRSAALTFELCKSMPNIILLGPRRSAQLTSLYLYLGKRD